MRRGAITNLRQRREDKKLKMEQQCYQLLATCISTKSEIDHNQLSSLLKAHLKHSQASESQNSTNSNGQLLECLSSIVSKKESEIEKLCTVQYKEYIDSITNLSSLRSSYSQTFSSSYSALLETYSLVLRDLGDSVKVLDGLKKKLNRVEKLIDVLKGCLFVCELERRCKFLVDEGKFYSALKGVDELENLYLMQLGTSNYGSGNNE